MKSLFLILIAVLTSGCSTTFWYSRYTAEWYQLREEYENQCRSHYRVYIGKIKEIRSKDPLLTFEDSVDQLCHVDRESCTPPKKPERFDFLENIGRPMTADYCQEFI
jgi:hypothetical protein